MVDLDAIRLTSEDMWQSALVTALIDVILVAFLVWRINRERFHRLRWPLTVAAGLFWGIFAIGLYQIFWDSYVNPIAGFWDMIWIEALRLTFNQTRYVDLIQHLV